MNVFCKKVQELIRKREKKKAKSFIKSVIYETDAENMTVDIEKKEIKIETQNYIGTHKWKIDKYKRLKIFPGDYQIQCGNVKISVEMNSVNEKIREQVEKVVKSQSSKELILTSSPP